MRNGTDLVDWQETQNDSYLQLLEARLKEPKLLWVEQFVDIINREIVDGTFLNEEYISINDYGCNVGHFFRGINDINYNVRYLGMDISDTYLQIAKKNFGTDNFRRMNIADTFAADTLTNSTIGVISATLEHIDEFDTAVKNIFSLTHNVVIMRTFLGPDSLYDWCRTKGAKSEYLIRQFTYDELTKIPLELGWSCRQEIDLATQGNEKLVCNSSSIPRKQSVFIFKKSNE